jgi:hypothetical protein
MKMKKITIHAIKINKEAARDFVGKVEGKEQLYQVWLNGEALNLLENLLNDFAERG